MRIRRAIIAAIIAFGLAVAALASVGGAAHVVAMHFHA